MPDPLLEVTRIEYRHDRVLRVWFDDGTVGAVAFPGHLDLAPESLYEKASARTQPA